MTWLLEVIKVNMCLKCYQAKCSGSRVIVLKQRNKPNDDTKKILSSLAIANSNKINIAAVAKQV